MDEFPKLINSHDNSAITINQQSFSIGRSLSCDHIIQSLGVSRFHCIIKKCNDKWMLFDRSSNGTLVNSNLYKFNESVELKNGDIIKLGPSDNLEYVFTEELPPDVVEEFQQPFEVVAENCEVTEQQQPPPESVKTPEVPKPPIDDNLEVMENELTCSICSELFIKAVTLNCSHSFCKHCINQWKKNKSTCPICRKRITNVSATLVLDNFIEKIISKQSDEVRETRQTMIKQREEASVNTASSSSNVPSEIITTDTAQVIEIYSDDDDDDYDSDSDHNYYSDDHDDYDDDDDEYYDRRARSRNYYGGYGRCFVCNEPGHWANSCPLKRY